MVKTTDSREREAVSLGRVEAEDDSLTDYLGEFGVIRLRGVVEYHTNGGLKADLSHRVAGLESAIESAKDDSRAEELRKQKSAAEQDLARVSSMYANVVRSARRVLQEKTEFFVRDGDPIYSPNGLAITKRGMCNAGRTRDSRGDIHDYVRAVGDDGLSRVMHSIVSPDGRKGELIPKAILEPGSDPMVPDELGCEDPHVIARLNHDTQSLDVIMLYVAVGKDEQARIAVAKSDDFHNFEKIGYIDNGSTPDKDCVPFAYNGKLYLLRRPMPKDKTGYGIVISELDLETLAVKDVGEINPAEDWEKERIGAGFAFVYKDLIVVGYHGVHKKDKDTFVYSAGIMLLDAKDPSKVLYRTKDPVLVPRTDREVYGFSRSGQARSGEDKEIAIPFGASLHNANDPTSTKIDYSNPANVTVRIVYGAGDQYTDTAHCSLQTLLDKVMVPENKVNQQS